MFLLLPGPPVTASVNFWVGNANNSGAVAKPSHYMQAVAPLNRTRHDFDDCSEGQELSVQDLGGFYFVVAPISASVQARKGSVAGVLPISEPIAVSVSASRNGATRLFIEMIDPISSVGFVLMGLESSARLTVRGTVRDTSCTIPPVAINGFRRWVGMRAWDEEIRGICLEVQAGEDFGLDDLEIGHHAPEPGGPAMLTLLYVMRPKRRANSRTRCPNS